MKRLLIAITLACVLSGTTLAGQMPGVSPERVKGEMPGVATVVLTIISLIGR